MDAPASTSNPPTKPTPTPCIKVNEPNTQPPISVSFAATPQT